MNKMKRLSLLLIILMQGIASHVSAQESQGFVVDEIIAKVDNYIVLRSELDKIYQDYLANGGKASIDAKCQYLGLLIRNKLMLAKAEIDSVVVLDADVDNNTQRRMDMIMAQSGRSPDEMEQIYGKTMEQIRIELREAVREQMIVGKMEETITDKLTVTPAEVRKFYNGIPKDSLPFFSASVQVAQIVKVAKVSPKQEEATRNRLLDLRSRIMAGENFSELAKNNSDDPSVISNGGEMGWVGRGRMVPEFEAMAFKLKPGEVSMPFKSSFGLHIMQLVDRRGNEYNSRHILIAPKPSPEDLQYAHHFLDSIRSLIIGDSITFEKAAKEFSDDVTTKAAGGFFSDDSGASSLPVDELDPVVFFNIDSMKVGNISKPVAYRTDDGKDAVRILYYKARIAPHEASLEQDWHRIQQATLNQKRSRILERWFAKARHDVFISVDSSYDYCGILK